MNQRGNVLIVLAVIVGLVAIVGLTVMSSYNSFVRLSQEVDAQYSMIETTLQRRFDLIPNLVNSVKGAMAQEQEVFTQIADARARMAGAQTIDERVAASSELEGALGRLLVVMEAYPDLKSVDAVRDLMAQLEGTENRIRVERANYNDAVRTYNTRIKSFPAVIFSGMFGYSERTFFVAAEGAQQAPDVNFGN